MKKITLSLIAIALTTTSLLAQSVDQGRKFFYYQRYKSAKEQFEKTLAANPNNIDAVYWLGQTLLEDKTQPGAVQANVAAAKDLYQKTLTANGSAPLVLVGIGHIELLEGKTNEARQRFETAISLSKGKDINVLNAIGRANVDATAGDANYVIEKLVPATTAKGFNSADTWLILGDAYRKQVDGGAAVTAYQKALTMDPKLAAAKYKVGKIYLTQGNKEYFLPAFEESIALDPNYAPGIYELYYYYYYRDIEKAAGYFDKYLAVADQVPTNEYDRISILYARKKYPETISAAQQKITAEADKADPRYYKLIAYSYYDQNDSTNAKTWLDQYFTKQKTEGFVPMDYSFRAQVLAKFPGNEVEALKSYEQAINADTAMESKLKLMTEAGALAKKLGNRAEEAKWLGMVFRNDPKANNVDLYNYAFAHYQAKQYDSALVWFGKYKEKNPDDIVGHLWAARTNAAIDTTKEQGIAVPDYLKFIEVAKKADSVKYKGQIVSALFYLASYSNDVKKDKDAAIDYLRQVTFVDPANVDAPKFIEILSKPPAKQPAPKQTPATKPKTGGTGSKPPGK
ncbi:MAG: tetratricopeptide repeat protein [Gemmatimonadaceae bacterium]|nr:tetratricopeptide repeat protein [Chitinophagaceae bacterium]